MSVTRGFIGVNGVKYTKISGDLTPTGGSGTPISTPGLDPITFSFLYAPTLGTSFSNTLINIPICSFDIFDHYMCEYLITLWNPNSDASGTGDVGNAITQDGYFFFDSMGNNGLLADANNLDIVTYAGTNYIQGPGVSVQTDLNGIGTNQYPLSVASIYLSPVCDGTSYTININQVKSGYKAKGLITLI
jgi:hypothetical protein